MVGGRKFRRKTFRLRRRCRLPFQLAGCCWNMKMAAWLVALTSRDPEYSSLRPAQIKWCITHVIPSQMIKWYNTCSLIDGKDASVYLIDWIPTSPDVFHWSWLMSPYTQHGMSAGIPQRIVWMWCSVCAVMFAYAQVATMSSTASMGGYNTLHILLYHFIGLHYTILIHWLR